MPALEPHLPFIVCALKFSQQGLGRWQELHVSLSVAVEPTLRVVSTIWIPRKVVGLRMWHALQTNHPLAVQWWLNSFCIKGQHVKVLAQDEWSSRRLALAV